MILETREAFHESVIHRRVIEMCLFCDIVDGKIPSSKVYENDKVLCFKDIKPATPVHVLIVPKKHFDDILDMAASEDGKEAIADVMMAVPEVVKATGIDEGFRIINNCREFGGQTVQHVHFHILGGMKLSEKMV